MGPRGTSGVLKCPTEVEPPSSPSETPDAEEGPKRVSTAPQDRPGGVPEGETSDTDTTSPQDTLRRQPVGPGRVREPVSAPLRHMWVALVAGVCEQGLVCKWDVVGGPETRRLHLPLRVRPGEDYPSSVPVKVEHVCGGTVTQTSRDNLGNLDIECRSF